MECAHRDIELFSVVVALKHIYSVLLFIQDYSNITRKRCIALHEIFTFHAYSQLKSDLFAYSLSPEFCLYHTKGFVSYFSFLSEQSQPEIRAQTKLRLKFKFRIKFSFLLLSFKYKSNLLLLYNLLDAGKFFQLFVATIL